MQPLNDYAMIELEGDKFGFSGGDDKGSAENGILSSLADKFNYFGFYSFAFEDSFLDEDKLGKLHDYYSALIGKRVYWLALSEKGAIVTTDDKKYAYIKLSSLIGWSEPDIKATTVGSGQFSA